MARIEATLRRGAVPSPGVGVLLDAVRKRATVTLNFHPDRIAVDGRSVAEALVHDGLYRNQFETRISNGGRSAFPGGARDRWEEQLFGGAYHRPGVTAPDRPRYGGLNIMAHADGACPRFGSCHLILVRNVAERTTFCFGDSHVGPRDVGTIDAFVSVLAALFEEAGTAGHMLGRAGMDVAAAVDWLLAGPAGPAESGRALDEYIEAQVHGAVDLRFDVAALVADPSFRGTPTGDHLEAASSGYDVELRWHEGFELPAAAVPADFRGPAMVPLAARVVAEFGRGSDMVNAAVIGEAARSLVLDPASWADLATFDETLQYLKQLWHVLVRYGRPDGSN